jgi:hypothetical protein
VSTGAEWERSVRVKDAELGGEYAQLFSPKRTFKGGSTTRETWFGGPVAMRVSPLLTLTNGFPPPVREICVDPAICATPWDEFFLSMGGFTDAAGHYGHTDIFANEYDGKVYADGELILDQWASVYMNTEVPSGEHRFRVVTDAYRENPFWQHSTRIRTAWGFTSDTPTVKQVREVLPLLGVNYLMDLSSTGRAAAGRYDFGVQFVMPNGLETSPVVKRSVEISWNGGKTWKPAKLTRCEKAACDVRVTNRAGGKATLRVKATDSDGNTVRQLVVNAYEVR